MILPSDEPPNLFRKPVAPPHNEKSSSEPTSLWTTHCTGRDKTHFNTHGKSRCRFWMEPTLEQGQALQCTTHMTHPEGRVQTRCPGCPRSGSLSYELSAAPCSAGTSSVSGSGLRSPWAAPAARALGTRQVTLKLTQRCSEIPTREGVGTAISSACHPLRDHPDPPQQPSLWGTPGPGSYSPRPCPSTSQLHPRNLVLEWVELGVPRTTEPRLGAGPPHDRSPPQGRAHLPARPRARAGSPSRHLRPSARSPPLQPSPVMLRDGVSRTLQRPGHLLPQDAAPLDPWGLCPPQPWGDALCVPQGRVPLTAGCVPQGRVCSLGLNVPSGLNVSLKAGCPSALAVAHARVSLRAGCVPQGWMCPSGPGVSLRAGCVPHARAHLSGGGRQGAPQGPAQAWPLIPEGTIRTLGKSS